MFDENTIRDEIHICDRVLEACRNKRRNRRNNDKNLVDYRPCAIAKPNCQTYEDVGKYALDQSWEKLEGRLQLRNGERHRADLPISMQVITGEKHESGRGNGTDKVAH